MNSHLLPITTPALTANGLHKIQNMTMQSHSCFFHLEEGRWWQCWCVYGIYCISFWIAHS